MKLKEKYKVISTIQTNREIKLFFSKRFPLDKKNILSGSWLTDQLTDGGKDWLIWSFNFHV